MRVYLDTSVYERPFDDQTQARIWLETLALALILQMVDVDEVELISSTVLQFENSRNPDRLRRRWMDRCLGLATLDQRIGDGIRRRAEALERQGLKAIDALHVACAEEAGAEYFLTCDDRLRRRYQGTMMRALNPLAFVLAVTGEQT